MSSALWISKTGLAAQDKAMAAVANNLANAGSWRRVFTERKQIKIARLITRES